MRIFLLLFYRLNNAIHFLRFNSTVFFHSFRHLTIFFHSAKKNETFFLDCSVKGDGYLVVVTRRPLTIFVDWVVFFESGRPMPFPLERNSSDGKEDFQSMENKTRMRNWRMISIPNHLVQNHRQMSHDRILTFSLEKRNYRTRPFVVVLVAMKNLLDLDDDED